MTLRMELTTDWSYERISAYGPQITAAFQKLEKKFPRDVEVQALFDDVMSGELMLWLIFDDDEFRAVLLTRIEYRPRTKNRVLVGTDLAGDGGLELASLVTVLEEYADQEGLDEVILIGRMGWRKALSKLGYEVSTVNYRKPIVVEPVALEEAA